MEGEASLPSCCTVPSFCSQQTCWPPGTAAPAGQVGRALSNSPQPSCPAPPALGLTPISLAFRAPRLLLKGPTLWPQLPGDPALGLPSQPSNLMPLGPGPAPPSSGTPASPQGSGAYPGM